MELFETFLSDTEKDYVKKASDFGKKHFAEKNITNWYFEGGIPDDVMWSYKKSGLGYMGFPKDFGGMEISLAAQMAIIEELSRIAATALPLNSQALSNHIISILANESQLKAFVKQYEDTARPIGSVAFSDVGSGSDMRSYKTAVSKEGNKLVLNGSKAFITNGMFTPVFFVLAKDLAETGDANDVSFSVWAVPRNTSGVSVYPTKMIGQRANSTANAVFKDVELSSDMQLGNKSMIREQINHVMNIGRLIASASSLGMAQAAFEDSVKFASNHRIGNEQMWDFQQIGLMLTQMQSKLISMRAHIYNAAVSIESKDYPGLWNSVAKYYVPQTGVDVASMAMQIMGSRGYESSSRVGRIWRDIRGNQYASGTDQAAVNLAAKQIIKRSLAQQEQSNYTGLKDNQDI
ncbi:acyl-CoA dehydrogenase [Actinomycetota bacterium]|nr:acyl-CoA dehydrogenase [Actinomycetota bacterium]